MQATTEITKVTFDEPEEGVAAGLDRLVRAVEDPLLNSSARDTLILLSALACGSNKVVSMRRPAADLDDLHNAGVIHLAGDGQVVLT